MWLSVIWCKEDDQLFVFNTDEYLKDEKEGQSATWLKDSETGLNNARILNEDMGAMYSLT